jgi:hypothetical protein
MADMNDSLRRKDKPGLPATPGVTGGAFTTHEHGEATIEPLTSAPRVSEMPADTLFTAAHPKTGAPTEFRKIWDEDRWLVEDLASNESWRMYLIDDSTVEHVRQGPPGW